MYIYVHIKELCTQKNFLALKRQCRPDYLIVYAKRSRIICKHVLSAWIVQVKSDKKVSIVRIYVWTFIEQIVYKTLLFLDLVWKTVEVFQVLLWTFSLWLLSQRVCMSRIWHVNPPLPPPDSKPPFPSPRPLKPERRHGSTRVPGPAFLAWRSSWRCFVNI